MQAVDAVRLHWLDLECYVRQQGRLQHADFSTAAPEEKESENADDMKEGGAGSKEGDSEGEETAAARRVLSSLLSSSFLTSASTADDEEDDSAGSDVAAFRFPAPSASLHSALPLYYLLDPSSLLPVRALALQPHHSVLDMCAAPGGKSLAILFTLAALCPVASAASFRLTCNELSAQRRARLTRTLASYVPAAVRSRHVTLTGHDATSASAFPSSHFHRVLLDAPCSSERHVLHSAQQLSLHSAGGGSRGRLHAEQQERLLQQAVRAARAQGGRVVYSTCSINPRENEEVVKRVCLRWGRRLREVTDDREEQHSNAVSMLGERREWGRLVLPDRHGFGPLYYCALERVADEKEAGSNDASSAEDEGHASE